MKLNSCYISHFGKINEFSYEFNDGFNPILQENGWGKTTFSVFIKAMFYGLEYSPNTKKKLLERNHYMPWDGSVCGGNIVFTVKDKSYRVERTFGKTDKDDTFKLFDATTGLESSDYSENIGEELFKVDRDSFEKSVYVPQLSVATSMTDSLNAKMGNLASAKDDISNFDIALKAVKDARGEYTRNSKVNPGKLHALKLELNRCREDMEKLPGIIEGYEAQSCLIEEKQQKLDELTESKNALAARIQNQSKKEQELGAYKAHKENLEKEQESLGKFDDFFAAGMPEEDELTVLEQVDRDIAVHERALEGLLAEQKKNSHIFIKPFEERLPDETEFAMWNKMATNLSELRAKAEHAKLSEDAAKQLSELKFFFDKKVPTEEELASIEKLTTQIAGLDGRISQANERLIILKAQNEQEKKHQKSQGPNIGEIIGIIVGIFLIVSGVIFSQFTDTFVGFIIHVLSFSFAIVDILLLIFVKKRNKSSQNKRAEEFEDNLAAAEQELQELKDKKQEIEGQCTDFLSYFLLTRAETMQENVYEIRRKLDQYRHLLEEEKAHSSAATGTLDELADLQFKLYNEIQPFATAYGINLYDMGEEFDFLNQLKRDADRYSNYLVEQEEISRHENSIKTMSADIEKALNNFPVNKEYSRGDQIHEIINNISRYKAISARIQELENNIADFESKNDVDETVESVDNLQMQQATIDEEIVDLNRQLIQDKDNMLRSGEEIERLGDISEQIERLETKKSEYQQQTELLGKTAELLTQARESFLSKYMEPLQNGLHKYLGMMDSPEGTKSGYAIEDYELDMDLNIKLSASGATKTSDYLSQGYQDLVAMCSRLALVDVLYSDEKPILILDDPFTNLDDKKIKQSLQLLEKISKERQTIYFTCHDSRL